MSRLPVPIPPADLLVMLTANKMKGKVSVGTALNASSQGEIAATLDGRGPKGVVAIAAVLSNTRAKAFRYNGKPFGQIAEPVKHLRGIAQFSIVDRREVSIAVPDGRPILSASAPTELAADSASCYFFVGLPSNFESDSVRPCWCRSRRA